MAEVADLFLEEEDDDAEFEEETLDPDNLLIPVFSPFSGHHHLIPFSDSDSDSDSDDPRLALPFDRPPPPFMDDPFPETLEGSSFSGFRVLDAIADLGSDYLGLRLGLGLGFQDGEDDEGREIAGSGGLRVVWFGSDSGDSSDSDERVGSAFSNSNSVGGLCWDCLRIDDDDDDDRPDPNPNPNANANDEFEWEEIDGRPDEQEILRMMIAEEEELRASRELDAEEEELRASRELDAELDEEVGRNVEWEVLLAVNNFERNLIMEAEDEISDLGDDPEVFINHSEYEVLFGQFAEHDSPLRGSPPAAKSVVESLPEIVLTEEDRANNNAICAVCKDEIPVEEKAKRLPCSHHYHGECILPWLRIRNNCPVCRYELPTDDTEYESWRAGRDGRGDGEMDGSMIRYELEMFPDL